MTTALGPVAGGWLIEHLSWRAAFLVNLPLAAAVLLIVFWRVPDSRGPRQAGGLDWAGSLLAALGLGGLVYGLIESPVLGWGPPCGVDSGCRRRVCAWPVRDRGGARTESRHAAGAVLARAPSWAPTCSPCCSTPRWAAACSSSRLNLIQVQGYSSTAAGAALLPFILLMFLLQARAGGLVDRHGARKPLIVGSRWLRRRAFALFALLRQSGRQLLADLPFPAVLVLGVGMTIACAPLTTTVMNAVPPGAAGTASGINNAAARVAALLAIAVLGIVMARVFDHRLERALGEPPGQSPAAAALTPQVTRAVLAQRGKLAAIEIPVVADPLARAAVRQAVDNAFRGRFSLVMLLSALLAAGGAACAWLFWCPAAPTRPGKVMQAPSA
ncbi:MFS transporter [Cupriavidus basilensis]